MTGERGKSDGGGEERDTSQSKRAARITAEKDGRDARLLVFCGRPPLMAAGPDGMMAA